MENDDFEKILTVKEFDRCCSFYHGIFPDMKKTVVSNFLIKFILTDGKTLDIRAAFPFVDKTAPEPTVLNFQSDAASIGNAVLFLMHNNYKFSVENDILKTVDPDGNDVLIGINGKYDPDFINSNQKTEKVQLA